MLACGDHYFNEGNMAPARAELAPATEPNCRSRLSHHRWDCSDLKTTKKKKKMPRGVHAVRWHLLSMPRCWHTWIRWNPSTCHCPAAENATHVCAVCICMKVECARKVRLCDQSSISSSVSPRGKQITRLCFVMCKYSNKNGRNGTWHDAVRYKIRDNAMQWNTMW